MVDTDKYKLTDLSPQLFWDTRVEDVSWDRHDSFIVERVLEYGMMKDWNLIKAAYGLERIKEVSLKLRSLSDLSLSFLCWLYNLEKEQFRCYTLRQSNQAFWHY